MKPRALILYGYGINCDNETQFGFEMAGAEAQRVHINQLIAGDKKLNDYQIFAFPGGFSFGDDLGAGKVLAMKIRNGLAADLDKFIGEGKLIIGICNGFQVLAKLGVLPGFDKNYNRQDVTLAFNDSGRFEDRWVYLKVNQKSPCVFTKGIENIYLSVRHGEGKFICKDGEAAKRLIDRNQVALQYVDANGEAADYPFNPNGAYMGVAGICDESGRIFGLMPHPEGFLFKESHPRWTRENVNEGLWLKIFKNAVDFVKNF